MLDIAEGDARHTARITTYYPGSFPFHNVLSLIGLARGAATGSPIGGLSAGRGIKRFVDPRCGPMIWLHHV